MREAVTRLRAVAGRIPQGVVIALAVCVVLGGTATAARLITGAEIKNGTLTLKDFKASERAKLRGPRGPRGAAGPQGIQGLDGATGPAGVTGATGPSGALDPVPAARLRSAVATSVPSGGSAATASWEIETYDTSNLYDPAQPTRLTAPIDGIYVIDASTRWGGSSTGDRGTLLVRNGTTIIGADIGPTTSSSFAFTQNVSTQYRLAAGDFIEVRNTTSTSALNTVPSTTESGPSFAMTWVGPG